MGTRQSPDRVVVVGAGVVGLSTAWFLQERGVEVTVVDRDGVAADASWGNAGWLAPALTLPLPEPAVLQYGLRAMLSPSSPVYVPLTTDLKLIRFLVGFARHCTPSKWQEAMSVYTEVNRTALGAYDELADGGVKELTRLADPFLAAFASEKDRQTLVDEFHHVEAAGGEVDFDLLDYDAIHSLEPSLGQGVKAGLRLRNQRFIDPPLFVNSLADAVRERGGEIVSGFDVTQIDDHVGGVSVRSAHGDSRDGDAVVISSGARLNKLAAPFGVRKLVQAGRGYSFSVKPEHLPKNPVYFPTQRVACTPLHDRFRVAGMMEFRSPDAPLDPRRVQAIIDAAKPMLSGIDWTAREEEWVGSRPCTTDGLPLIGATRSPRVHVAGGHGMWGIALGPLTGKMVADSMTGAQTPTVMSHFDPLR
ncbi:amino acid dehydrogenase [Rhodococcus sp. KBW08]|uniref:NAD(P)/FAD-dependent oxidoreductase n=1 Tax=Rhodococcus sp. KBW08 TaxID=2144188 RepID=UPI000F5B6902|nr:FAD-dependent oxidoreductase [Rhodococcus sp. KBW08]RQO47356.1 amino acid dehydrogenase [Rhodococcus sp. KBW08]